MCRFHRVKQTVLKSELHTLITLFKRFESEKQNSVICYESEGTIEREKAKDLKVCFISPNMYNFYPTFLLISAGLLKRSNTSYHAS